MPPRMGECRKDGDLSDMTKPDADIGRVLEARPEGLPPPHALAGDRDPVSDASRRTLGLLIVLRVRDFSRFLIDAAFGDRRQLFVGGLFLVQRLLKQVAASVCPMAWAQATSVP